MIEVLASMAIASSNHAVDIRELSAYRAREALVLYFGSGGIDAAIGHLSDRELTGELDRICSDLESIRRRDPEISLLESWGMNSECWVENPFWNLRSLERDHPDNPEHRPSGRRRAKS